MVDFWLFGQDAIGTVDLDYIKAGLQLGLILLQPNLCGSANARLLSIGDKFPRLCKLCIPSGLDLHEDNKSPVPRNQVNFPKTSVIVAGNDFISAAP